MKYRVIWVFDKSTMKLSVYDSIPRSGESRYQIISTFTLPYFNIQVGPNINMSSKFANQCRPSETDIITLSVQCNNSLFLKKKILTESSTSPPDYCSLRGLVNRLVQAYFDLYGDV